MSYYELLQIKSVMAIVGIIMGIGLAVFLFIMVFPKSKGQKFTNPMLQKLHHFLQFNTLVLEIVLKGAYVIVTCISISVGLFLLFTGDFVAFLTYSIGVPIVQRLVYELLLMFVLLVSNVKDINKKLNYSTKENNE